MSQSKELRYIQRDPRTREITGHFANPQPGYAEEELPIDHPELVAFNERRREARLAVSPNKALERTLVEALERIAALERKLL